MTKELNTQNPEGMSGQANPDAVAAAAEKKRREEEARLQAEARARAAAQGQQTPKGTPAGAEKTGATAAVEDANSKQQEAKARAIKELKATVDKYRRAYQRGRRIWRALSLLFLHLILLFIAAAVFILRSVSLNTSTPPLSLEYRKDIILGLIIVGVVSFILLLEYLRNWRKHKLSLNRLEKLSVDMADPEVDLNNIRTRLNKILDDQSQSFLGSN